MPVQTNVHVNASLSKVPELTRNVYFFTSRSSGPSHAPERMAGGMAEQVKSRQRVQDHGEVFTGEREVNAMLDMVDGECNRLESRFLEPACGDGNFLVEILRRKLAVARKRYGRSISDYERATFVAVSSIYGVDILADNCEACRERLFGIFADEYGRICKRNRNASFLRAVRFVLNRNVLCGNALSMKMVDAEQNDTDEPIVFSEWTQVAPGMVKRRDFRLDELLEGTKPQMSLFGASGSAAARWEYDEETQAYIPLPIKEFPPTDIYNLGEAA